VLFSSEGYFPALMTARAADNGIWLVAASGDPANVWDSAGHQGGEPAPYGTKQHVVEQRNSVQLLPRSSLRSTILDQAVCTSRTGELSMFQLIIVALFWDPCCAGISAPSSIMKFHRNHSSGMIVATLDLTKRYSPAWWGGPMRSAPGGRRVRYSGARLNDEDVVAETSKWWER